MPKNKVKKIKEQNILIELIGKDIPNKSFERLYKLVLPKNLKISVNFDDKTISILNLSIPPNKS